LDEENKGSDDDKAYVEKDVLQKDYCMSKKNRKPVRNPKESPWLLSMNHKELME